VLAGTHAFIGEAWRWKQRIGGAMRQAGICAAACLYALDHNVERLAEDHANARALGAGLAKVPGLAVEPVHTNLVFVDTSGTGIEAAELARRARDHGVLVSVMGRYRMRACTHLDVDAAGIEEAVQVIRTVAGNGAMSLAAAD
jgi:threonine aldolase